MQQQPLHAQRSLANVRRCGRAAGALQVDQNREGCRIGDREAKCPVLDLVGNARRAGERIQRCALYQTGQHQCFDSEKSGDDSQSGQQAECRGSDCQRAL